MLMLMLCVSTAMADFTSSYSAASWTTRWKAATTENISEGLQAIITGHNCSGTVYYTWNEAIVSEQGDIQVTVDYTGGAHKIQILGIEVVGTEIADYHLGASGGSDSNNVYTLSGVPAGEYDIRVFVCDKSGDHSLANTTGNIIYVGNITEKTYAPSEISTEYCYKIVNRAYGRLLGADGEYSTSKNATDGNEQLWAFEKNEDGTYYLRNLGHDKYLGYNGSNNKAWPVVSSEPAKFVLNVAQAKTIWNEETFAIHFNGGDEYSNAHDANWGYENGRQVVRWLATETASQWYFIETTTAVGAQAVTVKYEFEYNSEVKYTQETETFVGEEYPTITTTFPFGVSAVKPEGTISTADVTEEGVVVKEIELTVNVPFEYANSYSEIEHWYFMNIRDDNPTYLTYNSDVDYIPTTQTSVPSDSKDNYTWAFVGDPFNGYKIVNYAAGETMFLSAPEAPTGEKNAAQLARMVEEGSATGNRTWIFMPPTHSNAAENCFYIQHPTATSYAFNRQSYNNAYTLCYWTGRDTGSAVQLVERDFTGTAELQALIDQVDAAVAVYGEGGTTVGYYTAESTTKLAAALAAAKVAVADPNRTAESNAAAQTELMAAVTALQTIQPETGKFYTIASASVQNNDSRTGDMIYVDNAGVMHFADASAALGNAFQFVDAGNGQFYLYNALRNTYLNTARVHGGGQETATATTTDAAVKVTITNLGCENIVKIIPENGAMLHAQVYNSVVVGWNNEAYDNGSAWRILEVDPTTTSFDATISEAGYSTLYLGCDVTIPEGVEAYTVTSLENGEANLAAVEGAIPAKTAVILKKAEGQPAEATTYSFNYAESAVAAGENMLLGSTIDTYVEGPAYILAMPEGKEVGLYTAALNKDAAGAEGETHFKNNAFKAYMPKEVANESAYFGFRLPGTTGIENVTVENGVKAIYDLTGRRVESVTAPGIYIVNGKKVLVK